MSEIALFNPAALVPIQRTSDRPAILERRCHFYRLRELEEWQWEQLRYEILNWANSQGYREVVFSKDFSTCELVVTMFREARRKGGNP